MAYGYKGAAVPSGLVLRRNVVCLPFQRLYGGLFCRATGDNGVWTRLISVKQTYGVTKIANNVTKFPTDKLLRGERLIC